MHCCLISCRQDKKYPFTSVIEIGGSLRISHSLGDRNPTINYHISSNKNIKRMRLWCDGFSSIGVTGAPVPGEASGGGEYKKKRGTSR